MTSHARGATSSLLPASSNVHTVDLTGIGPGEAVVSIPSMPCGSERVIAVHLSKAETDLTVIWPYFEPYTPASTGALAAASALRVKNPEVAPEEGPPSSYVSEFQRNNAGLNMYFATSPQDVANLTAYEWVECVTHSRSHRFPRPQGATNARNSLTQQQPHHNAAGPEHPGVGAPDDDDDTENTGARSRGHASGDSTSQAAVVQTSPPSQMDEVVFGISNARNIFYIALHAPVTLRHVEIMIRSHSPLRARDDIRHPLRMCRLHHVTGDTFDAAVEWITRKRTSLQQGLLSLTEDGCEAPLGSSKRCAPDGSPLFDSRRTFLHVIVDHLGDPRFARMLVKHCSRFLRKDEKDAATERTTVQALFVVPGKHPGNDNDGAWLARSVEVFSAEYYRMLELLRLLVEEVQVNLDEEDFLGNTVVHYAACGHRRGSELLPILLMMGAPPASINLAGHTPRQELLARQRRQGLMTWDVDEALELLQKHTDRPFEPVAMAEDSITSAVSSKAIPAASNSVAAATPLESAVVATTVVAAPTTSLNHEASVAAATQKRRDEVAKLIGQGVDLPRVPLKLVDVVPLKVRPLGSDATRAFPTQAIDVDDTGYPVRPSTLSGGSKHFADDVISSRGGDALEAATTTSVIGNSGGGAAMLHHIDDDEHAHGLSGISEATMKLLHAEFNALDHDNAGWIPVSDMRRVYLSYDGYGVAESTAEIDKMISVMGIRRDGVVTFDEYCILMLRMTRL